MEVRVLSSYCHLVRKKCLLYAGVDDEIARVRTDRVAGNRGSGAGPRFRSIR